MALEIIRHLSKAEQERALNHVSLLNKLTPLAVERANPEDFCERDREFLDRLKYLTRFDPSVLSRIRLIRAKLRKGLPVLSHEWEELLLALNLKGFYDSGLDIRHATLHGSVDLKGAVIGGDFNASHSTVLGDSNEQRMLVLGSIIETGRVVQGEHSIGAQIRLEDHTAPQSIRRPILEYEVDLSELEREARLTASGDRISLGMKIDVDLSALEANTDTERFPTDPTTLRSVTAEQLQSWRDALQGAAAELLREKDDRGLLEVRSLRPSREPRASVASPRPGAASRPKYLADKQAQPRARVRRDSLRPPPAAVEPVEPRRSHPPRTRRGASRGQRPPLSLRSIDKGWDELSQDD